jgi:two-component system chemotaxis sensor kinase CheA
MDSLADIKQTFFQECEEQLAELETGLLALQEGARDSETVNAVFRAVHSVKGGAGAFSLDELVRFAHVFETALDEVRAQRLSPEPDVVAVLLRSADVLADLVGAARDGGTVDAARCAALAEELAALGGGAADVEAPVEDDLDFGFTPLAFAGEPSPPASAGGVWVVAFRPQAGLYAKANETAILLRELGRLGDCETTLDASALPLLDVLDPEGAYLAWTVRLHAEVTETPVREVFEFVDGDCDLEIRREGGEGEPAETMNAGGEDIAALLARVQAEAPLAPQAASPAPAPVAAQLANPAPKPAAAATPASNAGGHAAAGATIRVDLDRVDRLIDLVGELVINQAVLSQRVLEAGLARASAIAMGLDELEQLTRGIQDSVMAIRAQPVKSVFQRMPRLVREVAAMTGKQVRLVTEGEGTEVDKTVIERLTDPLTHMIRNAIDHGLESTERRIAAGKPAEGVVRLSALHRSGRIVIEVADDGGGIDRPRVRRIAEERGLINPELPLTDEETDNLIFLPGFSTADAVSEVSGRGVGMDVVKRSIQALGGRISISSRPGEGSAFTLSLPLTLAVLDGMVVSVAGQTLVAPLTAIVETLQPRAVDVHSVGGSAQVIAIRDTFTPLIDVGLALGFREQPRDAPSAVALLIESENGQRAALLVDAIQGQRQVVIKSLEANYEQVPGVAAATILGDGRVALILDIDTIVAVSRTSELARLELRMAAARQA